MATPSRRSPGGLGHGRGRGRGRPLAQPTPGSGIPHQGTPWHPGPWTGWHTTATDLACRMFADQRRSGPWGDRRGGPHALGWPWTGCPCETTWVPASQLRHQGTRQWAAPGAPSTFHAGLRGRAGRLLCWTARGSGVLHWGFQCVVPKPQRQWGPLGAGAAWTPRAPCARGWRDGPQARELHLVSSFGAPWCGCYATGWSQTPWHPGEGETDRERGACVGRPTQRS